MKYYIIAGEASGDLHASNLMRGLYECDRNAHIRFWGGDCMEQVFKDRTAALASSSPSEASTVPDGKAKDYREGAIMGFFEVVSKLGMIAERFKECKADVRAYQPDVLILVDYPGFNLKMAQWAHGKGIRVFYYIAPKVWATREWRIRKLKKYVDRMFIVFPFEKDYFDSKGLPYIYCGNPLVDAVDDSPALKQTRAEFCSLNNLDPTKPIVAMLAGSRKGEINTMTPLITGAVEALRQKPGLEECQFVVAGAPGRCIEDYAGFEGHDFKIVFGQTQQLLHAADAALVNSGTASLEAALIGTPQVVAYKVASKATYYLAKWILLKARYISLGNLCLDKLAFRELYTMEDCTVEVITEELYRLLTDKAYIAAMKADYAAIRESLGGSGASTRVAQAMVNQLQG